MLLNCLSKWKIYTSFLGSGIINYFLWYKPVAPLLISAGLLSVLDIIMGIIVSIKIKKKKIKYNSRTCI
jgi:hypothetical protein